MMDELSLLGSDWRTRSPDADQEYFIDKMRMLKARLRKYEEVSEIAQLHFETLSLNFHPLSFRRIASYSAV